MKAGYSLLILSDRGVDKDYAPIPCLLALAAVHNLLVREETRTQVALITESGEPREVMHFALLSGYGASAINPYLALESVEEPCLARRIGRRRHPRSRGQALHQGHQERPAEDFLEDGHLHSAELSGRAGFRSHRPEQRTGRRLFRRHHLAPRRHWPHRARRAKRR